MSRPPERGRENGSTNPEALVVLVEYDTGGRLIQQQWYDDLGGIGLSQGSIRQETRIRQHDDVTSTLNLNPCGDNLTIHARRIKGELDIQSPS